MTHIYSIVLEVAVDDDRHWWEALGLPAPERWNLDGEGLGPDVYARIVHEVEQRIGSREEVPA